MLGQARPWWWVLRACSKESFHYIKNRTELSLVMHWIVHAELSCSLWLESNVPAVLCLNFLKWQITPQLTSHMKHRHYFVHVHACACNGFLGSATWNVQAQRQFKKYNQERFEMEWILHPCFYNILFLGTMFPRVTSTTMFPWTMLEQCFHGSTNVCVHMPICHPWNVCFVVG